MVMSHRSPAYRGNPPDWFAPMLEAEPAREGRTICWIGSDMPPANVEVCRNCDRRRGKQCDECERQRSEHRLGERNAS